MKYTEQDLFNRAKTLATDALVAATDLSQLKKDFTYNKKTNLDGLPKEVSALVIAAAKIAAKNDYEEKRAKAMEVFNKFEEMTNYNV